MEHLVVGKVACVLFVCVIQNVSCARQGSYSHCRYMRTCMPVCACNACLDVRVCISCMPVDVCRFLYMYIIHRYRSIQISIHMQIACGRKKYARRHVLAHACIYVVHVFVHVSK